MIQVTSSHGAELENALLRLQELTQRVSVHNQAVVMYTGMSLAVGVAVFVAPAVLAPMMSQPSMYVVLVVLVAFQLFTTFGCIVSLLSRERVERAGMVLYQEISDELEWSGRAADSTNDRRPTLPIRLALREFLSASPLPLVRSGAAPAAYVAFNIVALSASAVWVSLYTSRL